MSTKILIEDIVDQLLSDLQELMEHSMESYSLNHDI